MPQPAVARATVRVSRGRRSGKRCRMGKVKSLVYNLIRDDDENGLASGIFDGVIIALIYIQLNPQWRKPEPQAAATSSTALDQLDD